MSKRKHADIEQDRWLLPALLLAALTHGLFFLLQPEYFRPQPSRTSEPVRVGFYPVPTAGSTRVKPKTDEQPVVTQPPKPQKTGRRHSSGARSHSVPDMVATEKPTSAPAPTRPQPPTSVPATGETISAPIRQPAARKTIPEAVKQKTAAAPPSPLHTAGTVQMTEKTSKTADRRSPAANKNTAGGHSGLRTDSRPALLTSPRPVYPALARRRGWEGTVLIRLRVDASGRIGETSLVRSSGHRILDRSALKQVRTWRFQPAMRDGKPVAEDVILPVRFELRRG